jgi:hypothetical protein
METYPRDILEAVERKYSAPDGKIELDIRLPSLSGVLDFGE